MPMAPTASPARTSAMMCSTNNRGTLSKRFKERYGWQGVKRPWDSTALAGRMSFTANPTILNTSWHTQRSSASTGWSCSVCRRHTRATARRKSPCGGGSKIMDWWLPASNRCRAGWATVIPPAPIPSAAKATSSTSKRCWISRLRSAVKPWACGQVNCLARGPASRASTTWPRCTPSARGLPRTPASPWFWKPNRCSR